MKITIPVRFRPRVHAAVLVVCSVVLASGNAKADNMSVSVNFTTFSGSVYGGSGPGTGAMVLPGGQICPDTGCGTDGQATNFPIGSAGVDTHSVSFFLFAGAFQTDTNRVELDPVAPFSADPKGEFKIGTLTFENGEWTGDADLGLSIRVNDTTLGTHYDFQGFVHMRLTPNTGSPAENADFIYFTDANGLSLYSPIDHLPVSGLRVYEVGDDPRGNIGSADLYATTGSLDLTRLANVTGAGFLDPSTTDALSTPEPGTFILAAPLLTLGWLRLRAIRRRNGADASVVQRVHSATA